MGELLRTEVMKLRTIRTVWWLLVAAQALVLMGVSGLVVSGGDLGSPDVQVRALGHAGLMSLVTLILGITAVAGEYRNRTITDTYLGTPRRGRVVLAKLGVTGAAGLGFGVVSLATALVATQIWCWVKGFTFHLDNGALWQTAAGGLLWTTTFAAIGVGLGALVRNLTAAVAVALAWLALVEGLLSQLLGGLGRWLPFASGSALNHLPNAASGLPQWGAAIVLVAYAAAFAIIATSTTVRRDVT